MSDSSNVDDTGKRGTKRKRASTTSNVVQTRPYSESQDCYEPNGNNDLHSKIAGKLHHEMRIAKQAAKKAKSFETKKLVRSLKALRLGKTRGNGLVDDAGTQLEIIKHIDPGYIGTIAIARKIRKDRCLSGHAALCDALEVEVAASNGYTPDPGTLEEKVLHRLLSSRMLARAVGGIVDDLRHVVLGDNWVPKSKRDGDNDYTEAHAKRVKPITDSGEDSDEASRANFEHMQAEDEYGQCEERDAETHRKFGAVEDDADATIEEESDSLDAEENFVDAQAPSHRPAAKTPLGSGKNGVKSTFLPSLAVGFTRGDSTDSDWNDEEADGTQKKNRRGQRARRAIWEKKYGQNANHKRREREKAEATSIKGRRAQAMYQTAKLGQEQQNCGVRERNGSMPGGIPEGDRAQVERKDRLHPSWEAKKRLKEKELGAAGRGTKIKF